MDGVSLGVAIKDNYALYLQEMRIKATFLYNLSISRCCYLFMSKLRVLFCFQVSFYTTLISESTLPSIIQGDDL